MCQVYQVPFEYPDIDNECYGTEELIIAIQIPEFHEWEEAKVATDSDDDYDYWVRQGMGLAEAWSDDISIVNKIE